MFKDGDNHLDAKKLTSYPTASNWLVGAGEAYVKNVYTNTDRGLSDSMYKNLYGQCFLIYEF